MPALRTVVCEECGRSFETRSSRARFCPDNSRCRKAASRRPAVPDQEPKGDAPSGPPAPTYDSLAEQVQASLSELLALDTISGRQAVRVAQQIDRGRDSGSAVATLSKELSRLVEEAKVESAPRRKDGVDDIAGRAEEKLLRLVQ